MNFYSQDIPQHGPPTPFACLCDRKGKKNFSARRRREENWQDILKIGKLDWSEGKGNFFSLNWFGLFSSCMNKFLAKYKLNEEFFFEVAQEESFLIV